MLAGISTACFYPQLTEWALRYIAELGAQSTELFFNAPSEVSDPFVKELRRIADDGGVKVVSVHPFTSGLEPLLFFSDYRRRFDDGVELYKRYFHAANLLGAEILVIHGDRREATKPRSRYFDLYGELAEYGKAMGVSIAQENVPRCNAYFPEFFREMRAYLPDAKFVLDIKQAVRAGYSESEMVDAMGGGLCHIHASDHAGERDCLPTGQGELDLAALLSRARENGFDGGVELEVYRHSFTEYRELDEGYREILAAINSARAGK